VAAPNGLKIISGDNNRRNFTLPVPDPPMPWSGDDVSEDALRQKAIGFNCLNYNKTPEPSLYRHFLPSKAYIDENCPDGIRLELLFPQCWNGKDLDSKDHKDHMRFPTSGINGGKCPTGWDVVISQIFFETYYDPSPFKSTDGEFVLANGDPTGTLIPVSPITSPHLVITPLPPGFGFHGDLLIAWQPNVLQKAIDVCGPDNSPSDVGFSGVTSNCPVFEMVPENDQQACHMESAPAARLVKKDSRDTLQTYDKLPGNNPIQRGPAPAIMPVKGAAAPTDAPAPSAASVPTLSYTAGSSGSVPAGGNILIKATSTTADSSTSTSTSTSAPPPLVSTPTPPASSSIPPPAAQPLPATTPAPAPAAPEVNRPNVAYTTLRSVTTVGGVVYENMLVEEIVTVYVTEPAMPVAQGKVKREGHLRRHQHHHRGGF